LFVCLQKVYFAIFSAMPQPIPIPFFENDVEFQAQTFLHRTFLAVLPPFLAQYILAAFRWFGLFADFCASSLTFSKFADFWSSLIFSWKISLIFSTKFADFFKKNSLIFSTKFADFFNKIRWFFSHGFAVRMPIIWVFHYLGPNTSNPSKNYKLTQPDFYHKYLISFWKQILNFKQNNPNFWINILNLNL